MADVVPEKTIEAKTTPQPAPRKKNKFLASVKWALFFIILIIATAYGTDYYIRNYYNPAEQKTAEREINSETTIISAPAKTAEPATEAVQNIETEVSAEAKAQEEAEKAAKAEQEAAVREEVRGNIESINSKISRLEERNKNLVIYLTVKDLAASIETPESFTRELELLHSLTMDVPEITGRIDILKQSSDNTTLDNQMVTKRKLLIELDYVEKAIKAASPKGFRAAIENAFADLVKVTKTRGNVDATDYKSIISRARITLSKENLTAEELQQVINEVAKLGAPAENWVKRANNYKRIAEVTNYLAIYAKSKLAE